MLKQTRNSRTTTANKAKSLGVVFAIWRACLNICRSSFYQLRNLSKIRKYLTQVSSEIAAHAFTSKIDYCNSLLCGCRTVELKQLLTICSEHCPLESLLTLVNVNTWSAASEHEGRVFFSVVFFIIWFLFFSLSLLLTFNKKPKNEVL